MNVYDLSRVFWDYAFENPERIKPNHIAMYFFAIEHCNRLGWKDKFGFPTTMVMDAISIKSYNTYIKTLTDLVEFGFIKMVERSKNQYSANIIALSKFNKANNKALDKAMIKHCTKQSESTIQSISESTVQSIDSIDKPIYNITNLPINQFTNIQEETPPPFEEIDLDKDPIPEERKKVALKKESEIVDFFNSTCTRLSKVQLLTEPRKKKISARISEVGFEKVKEIITAVSESNFLNGENPRNWTAEFDWILEPKNFTKILEGNYKNKTNGNNRPSTNGTPNLALARRR